MGRHKEPPHLWERPERRNAAGKLTHKSTWIILDGKTQTPTHTQKHDEAFIKLAEYTADKYGKRERTAGQLSHEVLIGDCISYYLEKDGGGINEMPLGYKRNEVLSHIADLNSFWGDKYVSDIKGSTMKEFHVGRKPSVTRNKLIKLRAIIHYCASEKILKLFEGEIKWNIKKANKGRVHTFTTEEVKALFRAAWRKRHKVTTLNEDGSIKRVTLSFYSTRHVAKFLVVALATGTRADRICQASFYDEPGLPWIDLEGGVFWRFYDGEIVADNKRADAVQIHPRLLRLLKRWRDGDGAKKNKPTRYLVEYHGKPADCSGAFERLVDDVVPETGRAMKLNRHILKHTCVTYLIGQDVSLEEVANYVSTTPEILRKTYTHLLAGSGKGIQNALDSKPEQTRKNLDAKAAAKKKAVDKATEHAA